MLKHFPQKKQTAIAAAKLLWNNFILYYEFSEKIFQTKPTILGVNMLLFYVNLQESNI